MKTIRITTNVGVMIAQLFDEQAPKTVENFLRYVNDGFYNGTIFHRVIKSFMIQGGGFQPGLKSKPTAAPIENEANNLLKNKKYSLAMARTNAPHSATAQFFINSVDNDFLNFRSESPSGWGYAVFGEIVEGTEVVHAIERVRTTSKLAYSDVPVEDVIIEKIELIDA